jgi:glycosyltransferase involved in cell wall biosynthesis
MKKCIDSLLNGGEDVEIIIVNDGSSDGTADIANKYLKQFPSIVKVVHKQNGGHGSGINVGISLATGLFFKVVDSDDWIDKDSLKNLIKTIKTHYNDNVVIDLYITNFIYDKVYDNANFVRRFNKRFPINQIATWRDVKKFKGSEVILMHSLTFRTKILQDNVMELPKHTFYVDNLYAYQYLPYVKQMYYMDINLYHYFIGREEQSVNMVNFVDRYEQQIKVMLMMIKTYTYQEIKRMDKGLRRYMLYCLSSIMIVTIMFTTAKNDVSRKRALDNMWLEIKSYDSMLYRKLKFFSYPSLVGWIPFSLRGHIMKLGYKILTKRVKLG